MLFKFNNLTDLLVTFNTEEKCKTYFEQQRWKGKITCPHCQHEKIYRTSLGFKCASPKCYKKFTVTVGTVFENTNIKLQKWFMAIYLFTAHKKGISSCQLGRDIGVSQKSAWFMLHRIREIFSVKDTILLSGEIQADETYIGGKTKNMHKWKREIVHAAGSSAVHMNPVFGMSKDGNVTIIPVPETNGKTLQPIIMNMVERGSTLVTDGHGAYAGLYRHFNHKILNHEDGEFNRNGYNTNQIENFWSHMKRGISGIYHQVSGKHLARYCEEFAFRYNSRDITDNTRFELSLTQTEGRVTYKQLTANED